MGPTATSRLNGVRLAIIGTQQTSGGILDCVQGAGGGMSLGTHVCTVADFQQAATFSLLSPPSLVGAVSVLTIQQTQSYPSGLAVTEDNAFVPFGNAVTIPDTTVTGSYNVYNTFVASGGTLDPAAFTGPGKVDLTYLMTPFSRVDLTGGGNAGLGFDTIAYSLSVSLSYDYVDASEPATLALFGVATTGVLIARRRKRAA